MSSKDAYERLIRGQFKQGLREIIRHPRAIYSANQFLSDAALASLEDAYTVAGQMNLGIAFSYPFPFGLSVHLDERVKRKIMEMRQQFAGRTSVHAAMAVGKWNAEVARSVLFGLACGADTFTIHSTDILTTVPWRKNKAQFAAIALLELIEKLSQWHCNINIENVASPNVWGQNPHDFMSLVNDYQSVKLCLDTGHACNAGLDPVQLAIDFAGRIGEVHLVDTRALWKPGKREPDKHCAYGDGRVDLEAVLKALEDTGYAGPIVIEVEPRDLAWSLNWLHARSYI